MYLPTNFWFRGEAEKLRGRIIASRPAAPGSNLGASKNFSLDVAEIY